MNGDFFLHPQQWGWRSLSFYDASYELLALLLTVATAFWLEWDRSEQTNQQPLWRVLCSPKHTGSRRDVQEIKTQIHLVFVTYLGLLEHITREHK